MKIKTIFGFILVGLGVLALAYQGITYTSWGNDMNIGPMHMMTGQTHHIPLSPIVGAIALIGGVALLVVDRWKPWRAVTR